MGVKNMKLFVVSVNDEPGALANICKTVKPAKIKYISTQKSGYGRGFIKLVTDNDQLTKEKLLEKEYMFIEEPMLLVKSDDSSKSMFDLTCKLGDSSINIENMFALEPGVLAMILSPNDVDKVREMLSDRIIK